MTSNNWSNHPNYNCKIFLDDGKQYDVFANWLHNNHYDFWKGWHCEAGAKRLYIRDDLEVFGGLCLNDHLGSLEHDFDLLEIATCKRDRCTGCTDDLAVKKYNPAVYSK